MVKRNRTLYVCEECGLQYRDEELAEKCEEWCRKYKSCNLEITRHAVNTHKGSEIK
jgi:predicted ATP-dependent serine protease